MDDGLASKGRIVVAICFNICTWATSRSCQTASLPGHGMLGTGDSHMLVYPRIACWAMSLGLAALAPIAAAQPVFTTLVAIGSATPLVLGADGVLYGVGGGQIFPECPGGCGGMFSLTPPATGGGPWTETIIYSFTSIQDGIGAACNAELQGGLYGVHQYQPRRDQNQLA